jgi:aspartate/methionine/tyrosine aminotransferase
MREYEKRRDFLMSELRTVEGLSCVAPKGQLCAYPNFSKFGMKSEELT